VNELEKRISNLEIRNEVLWAIISALLWREEDRRALSLALAHSSALSDANLPYTSSLSDDQLRAATDALAVIAEALLRPSPPA
jgi:hypothetical protein